MKKTLFLLCCLLGSIGATWAQGFTPVPGKSYLLKCILDGPYAARAEEATVGGINYLTAQSAGWNYERSLFTIATVTEGGQTYYTIQHKESKTYVYAINRNDANSNVGTKATYSASDCLWRIIASGDGYNIIPKDGNNGWNVRGSQGNQPTIGQWTQNNSNNNRWIISEVTPEAAPEANKVYAVLASYTNGKCPIVTDANRPKVTSATYSIPQMFSLTPVSGGAYQVQRVEGNTPYLYYTDGDLSYNNESKPFYFVNSSTSGYKWTTGTAPISPNYAMLGKSGANYFVYTPTNKGTGVFDKYTRTATTLYSTAGAKGAFNTNWQLLEMPYTRWNLIVTGDGSHDAVITYQNIKDTELTRVAQSNGGHFILRKDVTPTQAMFQSNYIYSISSFSIDDQQKTITIGTTTNPNAPKIGKVYTLKGVYGSNQTRYISRTGENLTRTVSATEHNPLTYDDLWFITPSSTAGKYYVHSASADGKYMAFTEMSATGYDWEISQGTTNAYTALWGNKPGTGDRFLVISNTEVGTGGWHSVSKTSNATWSTNFAFTEQTGYHLYKVAVSGIAPNIPLVSIENGNHAAGHDGYIVTSTELTSANLGSKVTASAITGYTATPTLEGNTLTIRYQLDKSVIFTPANAGNDSTQYKKVRIASMGFPGKYATTLIDHYGPSYTSTLSLADKRQLWSLMGTKESFKLYNLNNQQYVKFTAHDQKIALTPNADEAASFVLDDHASGYALRLSTQSINGDGLHMNKDRGLLYWGTSDSNGGSMWNIELADKAVEVTIQRGSTLNPYPTTNTRMGMLTATYGTQTSQSICSEGIQSCTLYLTTGIPTQVTASAPFYGFTLQSSNLSDLNASPSVTFDAVADNKYQYLWNYHPDYAQYYRIPAITTTRSGDLLAVSDYRECHNDIGLGRVDQGIRYSTDNGKTWSQDKMIVQGDQNASGFHKGFGDPCLVADRESDSVLLITVAGDRFFPSADTKYWDGKHLKFARMYSTDGGRNWSAPEDISDHIYRLFSSASGEADVVDKAFMGSGRIFQSRTVKIGSHYRLYGALLAKPGGIRVIYSDDFGKTWAVLGGKSARPAPDGDEPKCEELPNGDIILSSRKYYGRYFNIFSFSTQPTAQTPAEGTWGSQTDSNINGGINVGANATNGEIMVVKAKRKGTEEMHTLVLQSIPFANSRDQVGVFWKDITDENTYKTSGNNDVNKFARTGWNRGMQVHHDHGTGSAYSTMTLQADGKIGFFYEEKEFERIYSMVYVPLDLSEITANQYESVPNANFEHTLHVGTSGYATLSLPYNAALPENVEVYSGSLNQDASYTHLTAQTAVKAKEGYVVKAQPGDYTFKYTAEQVPEIANNVLRASLNPTDISAVKNANTGMQPYVLHYKADRTPKVMFKKSSTGIMGSNKAYLLLPINGGGVKEYLGIQWGEDMETGIIDLDNNGKEEAPLYNLAGQRITRPTKGIYIQGGKKTLAK